MNSSPSGQEICKFEQVDFWSTTATEFQNFGTGMGDVSSYLKLGFLFAGQAEKTPELTWALHNWSPGVPLIIGTIIRLTGPSFYFPKMLFIMSLLLGLTWTILFYSLPILKKRPFLRFFFLLTFFALPDFRFQTVGFGYVVSEGWATAFFLIAVVFVYRFCLEPCFKNAIYAGLLLGVSSYTRALLDNLNSMSLKLLLVSSLCFWLLQILRKNPSTKLKSQQIFLYTLAVYFSYEAILAPWKYRNYVETKSYSLCVNTDVIFRQHWTKSELIAPWIANSNVPCRTSPELCQNLQLIPFEKWSSYTKGLTLTYIVLHPLKWFGFRAKDLDRLWFDNNPELTSSKRILVFFEGALYLALGLLGYFAVIIDSKRRRLSQSNLLFSIIITAFLLANIAGFTFAPYEHRYSLFFRLSLGMFGLLCATREPNTHEVPSPS